MRGKAGFGSGFAETAPGDDPREVFLCGAGVIIALLFLNALTFQAKSGKIWWTEKPAAKRG